MKKSPLHILHLEDDKNDAALIRSTLIEGGVLCEVTRVETQEDFEAALKAGEIDLMLSDYTMPKFDGLSAMRIAKDLLPDLPVILVSATLGEERAIESLKSGATDYVLKDGLVRLVPAVVRAMQEVEERAERHRLAAQFIEGQKMEVIGRLAGGVAHDFNNVLAVIMGYSELISDDLPPDSPLLKFTEEIRHASERAAGLTRQLLVFSRKQTVQIVVLDISDVMKEMEQMLMRLIDANVMLKLIPGEGVGNIRADSGYIGQVLMNLAVNARDAMPGGGTLTITTSNVTLNQDGTHERAGARPGDYVMLSVTDTGTGMTEEVKVRLFEAFFTTKSLGKGTGLGLATCQTIVQQCGGFIDVSSILGKGTTFNIYFPRVVEPIEIVAKAIPTGPSPRGSESVLIVEDDQSVRHLACSVLAANGYEVHSATNGQDALNVANEHEGRIKLVITDVILPLMDGKVMAEWLKIADPNLKVLFTSGYTDDAIANHGVLENGCQFLSKPYLPTTLVRKVRELLDGKIDGLTETEKGTGRASAIIP
jgi:two-component system, cell cycle sensor histidine kinase and response regulator CckA